jgi:hypothetical protein
VNVTGCHHSVRSYRSKLPAVKHSARMTLPGLLMSRRRLELQYIGILDIKDEVEFCEEDGFRGDSTRRHVPRHDAN